MARRRSLLALVLVACLEGCAHGRTGVVRRVDGQPVRGRVVSPLGYETALRLALDARGFGGAHDPALARRAIAANPGDAAVLALAIEAAPDDAAVLGAAEPFRGRSCSVDVALARHALPHAAALAALVTRCPEATAPAVAAARSEGDATTLARLASAAPDVRDPAGIDAVLDALVVLAEPAPLEAFVRLHRDEPRLASRAADRASSTDAPVAPPLAAALLAPLATDRAHALSAVFTLIRAQREDDARNAVLAAPTLPIGDAVALAELADGLGLHAEALAIADDACARGASTRADAVAASALRALGRITEADARLSRVVPDTAGAAVVGAPVTATP